MRIILTLALPVLVACTQLDRTPVGPHTGPVSSTIEQNMSFHGLTATDIHGSSVNLDMYKGRKIMVVNTASECGFTPQYRQLQELYETHRDQGFVILGFPSNDFGGQEPGSEEEIAAFCEKNYGVTFPLMAKVSTKGSDQHEVFRWLTNREQNGVMDARVDWNFNKFLIDEQGRLVKHLPGRISPLDDEVLDWLAQ